MALISDSGMPKRNPHQSTTASQPSSRKKYIYHHHFTVPNTQTTYFINFNMYCSFNLLITLIGASAVAASPLANSAREVNSVKVGFGQQIQRTDSANRKQPLPLYHIDIRYAALPPWSGLWS